jgi:hypothetical protein
MILLGVPPAADSAEIAAQGLRYPHGFANLLPEQGGVRAMRSWLVRPVEAIFHGDNSPAGP